MAADGIKKIDLIEEDIMPSNLNNYNNQKDDVLVEEMDFEDNHSVEKVRVTNIFDERKQCYSVTEYDKFYDRWNSGTNQRAVADLWAEQGSRFDHGIAVVNINGEDRYLIATTTNFGETGDLVEVLLEDGTTIKALLADAKSPTDDNWTEEGHLLKGQTSTQLNVIEWEVSSEYYDKYKNPSSDNGYELPWDSSSKVTVIKNRGTIL